MRIAILAAAVSLSIVGLSSAADVAAAIRKPTDIPAQNLSGALQSLAQARKLRVMFLTDDVANLNTTGISGNLTADEALTQLLEGTGLTYRFLNGKTVSILPASAVDSATRERTPVMPSAGGASLRKSSATSVSNRWRLAQASQEVAAGSTDNVPSRGESIETVTVTGAALGERTLLDTPFTVNAVTEAELRQRQVYTLSEAFARDAAVTSNGSAYNGWSSLLSVRGLLLDYDNSIKINGLPLSFFGVELPVEMFEQVQLLKGLSGFMYGFGAPGAIVNYNTKKPTETATLGFDVGYRTSGIFSQHADIGGRFGSDDRFGFRVNVSNENGSSYSDAEIDRQAAALALDARLTPSLTWTADVLYQDRLIQSPIPYFTLSYSAEDSKLAPRAPDGGDIVSGKDSFNHTKFLLLTTGLQWQINDAWRGSVDVSRTRNRFRLGQEYNFILNPAGDYAGATFDGLNIWNSRQAQAVLQGHFTTGALRHQVVVGANWQELQLNVGSINDSSWGLNNVSTNLYAPTRMLWTAAPYAGTPSTYRGAEYSQTAAFISDTISFSERWSLLAGFRYTQYEQYSYDAIGSNTTTYQKKPTTPTAALMFKPSSASTLYASYVESLEQGSQVSELYDNAGALLPPLKSKQYEVGIKIEQVAYRLAGAVFRIERGAEYTNSANVLVQNGIVRHDGVELGGKLRLTDDWSAGADAMWLDAAYQEGDPALAGGRVQGSPRFIASVNTAYDVAAVAGLSMHMDAKYTSSIPVNNGFTSSGIIDATVPSFTLVNLGGNYRTSVADREVTLRLQIQNLLDEAYWQGGFFIMTPGAPRTLALSIQVDL